LAHSSKVEGRPASSRSASPGGHPPSRRQRARMSLVELTNEIDRHAGRPLCRYWRCTIHCTPSLASAHLLETANCLSAMGGLIFYTFRKSLLLPKPRDVTYRVQVLERACVRRFWGGPELF